MTGIIGKKGVFLWLNMTNSVILNFLKIVFINFVIMLLLIEK